MSAVKHVVLLKLKPNATDETVAGIFAALAGLCQKVPGLLDFSAGENNSQEGLTRGFTHGFVMTFKDAASRDGYLPHPDHEAAKAQLLPWVDGGADGVIVMDWAE